MTANNTSSTNSFTESDSYYSRICGWVDCFESPYECAKNALIKKIKSFSYDMSKWIAFEGSNSVVHGTWDLGTWTAKKIATGTLSFSDWLLNKQFPSITEKIQKLETNAERVFNYASDTFNQWDEKATDYIAPNARKIHAEELKKPRMPDAEMPVMFSAATLVAPAILLGLCVKKTATNIDNALHHLSLLVLRKRMGSVSYTVPAYKNNMVGSASVSVSKTSTYALHGLVKDFGMEALFAALWGGATYITYDAIFDALKNAGNTDADAKNVARAIFIAVSAAPTFYSIAKGLIFPDDTRSVEAHNANNPFGVKPAVPDSIQKAMDEINWPDQDKLNPYIDVNVAAPAA